MSGRQGTLPTLADALCARLHCRNIAPWLNELADALDMPAQDLMPRPPVRFHQVIVDSLGLLLVLRHPHADQVPVGDPDRWLITDVKFGLAGQYGQPWMEALPFGLDPQNETPASAAAKLDTVVESAGPTQAAVERGDLRQTWFCNDALALEVTWRAAGRGIDHVWMVRMGSELLAPRPAWLHEP